MCISSPTLNAINRSHVGMLLCSNDIQRVRGVEDSAYDEIEGYIKYHPGRMDPFPNSMKDTTMCMSSPTFNADSSTHVDMST
jgi:hypothetical protein